MLVQLKSISHSYQDMKVLDNINLEVEEKKITVILGPSGSGKSTLLRIMSRLEDPVQGQCLFSPGLSFSSVFQQDLLLPWLTVFQNILFVRKTGAGSKVSLSPSANDTEKILSLLDNMDMAAFKDYYPHELSGGMRQRCALARAFFHGGDLLLMDEPFSSLDYYLRFEMVRQLLGLWTRHQCAVILVTHNIDEALLLGNRILLFSARPGSIEKVINIDIPQKERLLTMPPLEKIRSQIINHVLYQGKKSDGDIGHPVEVLQ